MEQKEIKKLLDKFNRGQCSAEELTSLQLLMEDADQHIAAGQDVQELKQTLWLQIEKRTQKVRPLYTGGWLKAAAILFIIAFAGIFCARVYKNREVNDPAVFQTITAARGRMKQIVLPDSTMVQLNAGTSIRFPLNFSAKNREVFLLDGEAFFDVKHDVSRPFLVHTAKVTTQVLGTSFNIKSYKQLPDIQVFVNSGKVEVHDQKHTMGMYTPRQQLTYHKHSESFTRKEVTNDHSLSWMRDELVLNDVSFEEVSVYLQNRYSVSFKYHSKKLSQQHYSVRLSNKLTIIQVIDILHLVDGRKYKLQGNTVSIT